MKDTDGMLASGVFLRAVFLLLLTIQASWAGAGGPCGNGGSHGLPEPGTLALLAVGVAGILTYRSRAGRKKK